MALRLQAIEHAGDRRIAVAHREVDRVGPAAAAGQPAQQQRLALFFFYFLGFY